MADRSATNELRNAAVWELAKHLYDAMEFHDPGGPESVIWAELPQRDREFYFYSLDRALFCLSETHNDLVGRRTVVSKETNFCDQIFLTPVFKADDLG